MARKKIGRNDPCPCGSGKKYKKCCLDEDREADRAKPTSMPLGGLRLGDGVLSRWSMERARFTPLAAEAVALGKELPGMAVPPWTRARIRDWFAQFDHPVARLPIVTLSEVRQYLTATLLEKLAQHGVELDEASFEVEAGGREGRSAWSFAAELLDRSPEEVPHDFALAVCELWRRLLPDRPSLEMLDELMEEGFEVLDPRNPREAVERWLSFTDHLVEALPAHVRDLDAADTHFPGLQSIVNWIFDAEMHVHNASLSDPELAQRGIAWCQALVTKFADDERIRSLQQEKAELHVVVGEPQEAVRVAEALRAQHPHDAIGYAALSDILSWTKSGEVRDLERAIQVLEEALRLPVNNGDEFDLEARLEDLRQAKKETETS